MSNPLWNFLYLGESTIGSIIGILMLSTVAACLLYNMTYDESKESSKFFKDNQSTALSIGGSFLLSLVVWYLNHLYVVSMQPQKQSFGNFSF